MGAGFGLGYTIVTGMGASISEKEKSLSSVRIGLPGVCLRAKFPKAYSSAISATLGHAQIQTIYSLVPPGRMPTIAQTRDAEGAKPTASAVTKSRMRIKQS